MSHYTPTPSLQQVYDFARWWYAKRISEEKNPIVKNWLIKNQL